MLELEPSQPTKQSEERRITSRFSVQICRNNRFVEISNYMVDLVLYDEETTWNLHSPSAHISVPATSNPHGAQKKYNKPSNLRELRERVGGTDTEAVEALRKLLHLSSNLSTVSAAPRSPRETPIRSTSG